MKKESVIIQRELGAAGKSMFQKYCDLIIGRRSVWALIRYELIMLLCMNVPGAWGLFLRSRLYPCLLKRCGRGVVFGMNVALRHPHKMEMGDYVVIDDNCLLDAKGWDNAGIRIGNGVFVGRNSILSCKNGDIVLEDNVNIGFNCEVFSGSLVKIGRNTLVAAYCYFIGGDHDSDSMAGAVLHQGSSSYGIEVGADSWFGADVKVRDRVKIGANVIVGAGAVVTKDLPDAAVAVGVPARVIRMRGGEQKETVRE